MILYQYLLYPIRTINNKAGIPRSTVCHSFSQVEAGHQRAVSFDILLLKIIEQSPALTADHLKPPPGMMILGFALQTLVEMIDPVRQ